MNNLNTKIIIALIISFSVSAKNVELVDSVVLEGKVTCDHVKKSCLLISSPNSTNQKKYKLLESERTSAFYNSYLDQLFVKISALKSHKDLDKDGIEGLIVFGISVKTSQISKWPYNETQGK